MKRIFVRRLMKQKAVQVSRIPGTQEQNIAAVFRKLQADVALKSV